MAATHLAARWGSSRTSPTGCELPDQSDKPAKGFSGFGDLVSDVEGDVAQRSTAAPRTSPPPTSPQRTTPGSTSQAAAGERPRESHDTGSRAESAPSQRPAPPTGHSSTPRNIVLAFVGLVILVLVIKRDPSPNVDSVYEPPAPVAPDFAPSSAAPPTAPTTIDDGEVRPPIQSGQALSDNEIRYCIAEQIRISAMDPLIDSTSQIDIGYYNDAVRDLNSRCGSFRYRRGVLQSVTAEVEARRAAVEQAGRKRWVAWRATLLDQSSAVAPAPPEITRPAPVAAPITAPPKGSTQVMLELPTAYDDPAPRFAAAMARSVNNAISYPRYALQRGEQGPVDIIATIGSDGALKTAHVSRSSGYPALDEAALNAVTRGTELPPIPEQLAGSEFSVSLPFAFRIE
jgi:TonB family protein